MLQKQAIANLPYRVTAEQTYGKHSFIQLALDAICDATQTKIAMLSTGLFLRDLPAGVVTENELHEALPHSMHLIVMTFTGQHLVELLEEMQNQEDDLRERLINGMGFRGKIFGEFVLKGLSYIEATGQWFAGDSLIDKNKIYRVAAVDHYWFIPFFPTIANYGAPQLIFPSFLRHVVADYMRKRFPLIDTGED